jgi:hypothetical protein
MSKGKAKAPSKGECDTESDDDEDFKLRQPRAAPSTSRGEVVTDEEDFDAAEDEASHEAGSVPMKPTKQALPS